MANVPLSQSLIAHINTEATKQFVQIITDTNNKILTDPELIDLIRQDLGTAKQRELANELWALNATWLNQYAVVYINYKPKVTFNVNLRGGPVPGNSHTYQHNNVPAPIRTRLDALFLPRQRAEADKAALERTLEQVLNNVPTLQRAVEVLPAILNWVPDDVRTKYYAPNPKREKRKDFDALRTGAVTDEALQAIARARIGTGT